MSRVVVLIPAHNEQDRVGAAIRSVQQQTYSVDRIIVVSDNSADRTPMIAGQHGAEVFQTRNNKHKKSGALEQAFARLNEPDDTFILVMDADSCLSSKFVEKARAAFVGTVGAVGGIFVGDDENGFLGDAQRLEYFRYAREIGRNKGKARVLTGTATMVRLGTLKEVATAREQGRLPGSGIYNREALTEDFELTICLKRLGYKTVSPKECLVTTETMPTIKHLWRQRFRWQRGALQTLEAHGPNKVTLPYVARQIETGVGLLAMLGLWFVTGLSLFSGELVIHPFWVCLGVFFQAERVISAWRGGWKFRIMASVLVSDLIYDMFIGFVYIASVAHSFRRAALTWGIPTIDKESI